MKVSTTVSIDEEILEAAKGFAKSERRSLSAQIEVWIAEKLNVPDQGEGVGSAFPTTTDIIRGAVAVNHLQPEGQN